MKLLSTLDSLDNVADGSTRKLLTTATSSGSGNAVTAVSISGDTLTYTKGSEFTSASILPNDTGEVKTRYRVSQKDYTGSTSTYWYYPICILPADNSSNYASVIISGRIGGMVNENMSYISALCWNRSEDGISVLDIAGAASSMENIWVRCDIVLYRDATSKKTTVYLKCNGYFTFDLDFEFFQSGTEVIYDGTYITTTPEGTLGAQASTSNKRMEIVNSKAYVAGNQLVSNTDYASSTNTGVVKTSSDLSIDSNNGLLFSNIKTYNEYTSGNNNMFISKGTLENVITGKELTNKTYVDEADTVFEEELFGNAQISGEGTNITLEDTTKAKMEIEYGGNTSQDGTPSPDTPVDVNVIKGENNIKVENKNLFDEKTLKLSQTTDGNKQVYIIYGTTGEASINYLLKTTLEENTQYTLSFVGKQNKYFNTVVFRYTDGTNSTVRFTNSDYQRCIATSQANKTINGIQIDTGAYTAQNYIEVGTIQLEEGDTATDFIEHQEQNYKINLASKNLCPTQQTSWEQGAINATTGETVSSTIRIRTIQYYPIQNNTDYYISVQDTTYCYLNIILYDSNKNYIGQYFSVDSSINGATSKKINIPSTQIPNVGYMKIVLRNSDNVSTITANEITTIKPQIEKGISFSTYEPYYNIEYCEIGDYADQFFKNEINSEFYDNTLIENEWYLKKNIGKVVLNGTESNFMYLNGVYYTNKTPQFFKKNTPFICNAYSYGGTCTNTTSAYNNGNNTISNNLNDGYSYYLRNDNLTNYDDWRNYIALNNIIFYYVRENAIYIQLSQTDYPILRSQLEDIYNNSKSYNGQTNISQTNDDLPFNISVSAFKNTTAGKIAELQEGIAELQEGKADKSEIPTKTSELQNDSNYVKNTDYATNVGGSKAGVIKVGTYGTATVTASVSATLAGQLYCASLNYSDYIKENVNYYISKGTLENVITGKGLTSTSFSQTLTSGEEIGTLTIDGTATKLYAPSTGSVNTTLSSPQQTYYLTGVQTTSAGQGNLYNSYLSSTYTGIKYVTSTSQEGGSLYVDDREVVTGLYYEIS